MPFTKHCFVIVSSLLVMVSFASCQKYPSDIMSAMEIVEKIQKNFYYDNKWMVENGDKIYHPDYNFLALHLKYKNLQVEGSDFSGEIVFSKFRVLEVTKIIEEMIIGSSDSPKQPVEVFVAKASYLALVNVVNNQEFTVYKEPKELIWYFLLIEDSVDGLFKIYDELPSFKVSFIDEELFKKNIAQYTQGGKILEMIETSNR